MRLAALIVAVGLVVATGASVATSGPARGGTLVIGSEGQHDPLDPHRLTGTVTLRITAQIYETLVAEDLTRTGVEFAPLRPGLAESWSLSPDRVTYTFKIRRGIKFHDGTPLNAEAVKTNFDRGMDSQSPVYSARARSGLGFIINLIASTSVSDDSTFVIKLKEPFASLPVQLSDRRMGIMSPTALQRWGEDQIGVHPAGTGPFRFVERGAGNRIVIERNPDYWGPAPMVDRIIFRPYTDETTLVAALQAGEVDVIMNLGADQIPALQKATNVKIEFADLPNIFFWMLNTKQGPTTNRVVRQALNYAINRESIAKYFMHNTARPAGGPVPVGNPVYDPSLEPYRFDRQRARMLLTQAGVPQPLRLKVLLPTSGAGLTIAPMVGALMQQDLRAVGVEVTFERLEWSAFLAKASLGLDEETSALYTGWTTGAQDPYWLERMFGSASAPPRGVNRSWYANPKVDDLLTKGRAEPDDRRRIALYREAAKIIADDAPWIFLYQDRWPRAISTKVQGFVSAPSPYVDLTKIWLTR